MYPCVQVVHLLVDSAMGSFFPAGPGSEFTSSTFFVSSQTSTQVWCIQNVTQPSQLVILYPYEKASPIPFYDHKLVRQRILGRLQLFFKKIYLYNVYK